MGFHTFPSSASNRWKKWRWKAGGGGADLPSSPPSLPSSPPWQLLMLQSTVTPQRKALFPPVSALLLWVNKRAWQACGSVEALWEIWFAVLQPSSETPPWAWWLKGPVCWYVCVQLHQGYFYPDAAGASSCSLKHCSPAADNLYM